MPKAAGSNTPDRLPEYSRSAIAQPQVRLPPDRRRLPYRSQHHPVFERYAIDGKQRLTFAMDHDVDLPVAELAVKAVLECGFRFVPIRQIGNFQMEIDVAAPFRIVDARTEQPDDGLVAECFAGASGDRPHMLL